MYRSFAEGCFSASTFSISNSFDTCVPTSAPISHEWTLFEKIRGCKSNTSRSASKKMLKENTMYNECNLNVAANEHLINRLYNVQLSKFKEAEEKYLPITDAPKTVGGLKKAVAEGWLTVTSEVKDDQKLGYGWINFICLQDPAKPHDRDAYNAEVKVIKADYTKAQDIIVVMPQVDGLAALNKFEATTYH